VQTDVSVEHIASIFRVEKTQHVAWRFLAELIFSTLKMEAIFSSETSVDTERTTPRYIPEDGTLDIN
jgi:hypothetical protein